ncbi:MAG: glycoside hydrolase family 130 protein [Chitinophagaceae bacterium]|nr:glycoside hydrolase family 130 protein [Chitinophagaceae bacterium]
MKKIAFLLLCCSCFGISLAQTADESWQLGPFVKHISKPIVSPDAASTFYCPVLHKKINWEKSNAFNPAAIVRNDKVVLLYRVEDKNQGIGKQTSRIGKVQSNDGIVFTKTPSPVLYPAEDKMKKYEWPGGCEDPRIVQTEDGTYWLTYTAWDGKTARLSIASSRDLTNWTKHGPIFTKAVNGKFLNTWSKSGAIVTARKKEKSYAVKINNKYWMYWGDSPVYLAFSDNLSDWEPVTDSAGNLQPVVNLRKNKFDSEVVEPGPPAIVTEKGILLLYNGMNAEGDNGDKTLPAKTYCGGQILFDIEDPSKILARCEQPFIKPDLPFEKKGQYAAGTTFIEGLVFFKGKWYLYYGAADSSVGVAVYEIK